MTSFILSQESGTEQEPGRVILDRSSHGVALGSISAKALTDKNGGIIQSAWSVARAKVDESKFYHIQNLGWFARETPK